MPLSVSVSNPDEIALEGDDDEAQAQNPDEIDLGADEVRDEEDEEAEAEAHEGCGDTHTHESALPLEPEEDTGELIVVSVWESESERLFASTT